MSSMLCEVPGCVRLAVAKGRCERHTLRPTPLDDEDLLRGSPRQDDDDPVQQTIFNLEVAEANTDTEAEPPDLPDPPSDFGGGESGGGGAGGDF